MKKLETKNSTMKYVELKMGEELEPLLHRLYVEENKSIREIADIIDVHYHTVNKWLKLIRIDMRLPQEKMLEIIEIKRRLRENV